MRQRAMLFIMLAGIFGAVVALFGFINLGPGPTAARINSDVGNMHVIQLFRIVKWGTGSTDRHILMTLRFISVIASLGAVVVAACMRRLGRIQAGVWAIILAVLLASTLAEGRLSGIVPVLLDVVAIIIIFSTPSAKWSSSVAD
jgi:hypothetical protein